MGWKCCKGMKFKGFLLILLPIVLIMGYQAAAYALPAGFQEFYLPLPTGDNRSSPPFNGTYSIFNAIEPPIAASRGMHYVVGVTASADNTTVYYDHWENGLGTGTDYDEKVQLNKGDVHYFQNSNIPVPRGTNQYYDGGDRIFVSGSLLQLVVSTWTMDEGTVFTDAWEIYPLQAWERDYVIPVGQDLAAAPKSYRDFTYVYALIMSASDSNDIEIRNSAGSLLANFTLDRGRTYIHQVLTAGTIVSGTQPVQVQLMTGRRDTSGWEMRGFTMMPSSFWSSSYYWSPVPSWRSGDTDIFLYNPSDSSSITVDYEDRTGTGSFEIPAGETRSYRSGAGRLVPQNSGVHLRSSSGTFWGIVSADTGSATWDWGCSLIPENFLGTDNYVSWAPGTSNLSGNGSPVFVSALEDNTRVFVDFGPNDGVFDLIFNLDKLQVYQVFAPAAAPFNNDNTGMHIVSNKPVSIAWGESPDRAATGNPYLDMGYTTLPLPVEWIDVALEVQKSASPSSIAVDGESTFTVIISVPWDAGSDVVLEQVEDVLPPGWKCVVGSCSANIGEPDDISGNITTGYTLKWFVDWTIEPGGSETFTFRGKATSAADTTNPNRNVATATGTALDATLTADDDAFVDVTALGPAVITAEKTWSLYHDLNNDGEVNPGDLLRYVIRVGNTGQSAAADVVITDDALDSDTSLVTGSVAVSQCPSCTVNKGNTAGDEEVDVSIGDLVPGATVEIWFVVAVSGIEGFDEVVNSGKVTAGGGISEGFSATTPVVIPPPVLTITKSAPAEVVVDPSGTGTIIQYTGTLTNTTQTPAHNVVLVDTLPDGVSFVTSSHSAVYDSVANTVTWNLGTLGPGASIPGWLDVKVAPGVLNETLLRNRFEVRWEDFDGDPLGPASAEAETMVYTHPQLTIEKAGPATAIHDEQFSYTITIRNIGDSPAFQVSLEDTLPAGLSYVGSSPAGNFTAGPPGKVVWTDLGGMQASGVKTVVVTVAVDDDVPNGTALRDTVNASWKDGLENSYGPVGDTAETIVYTAPILTITKSGPAEAVVGDLITFTGILVNVGGSDAFNVRLVDQLPAGMTFVSSSQNAVYNVESNTVTWEIGTVPAGTSIQGWLTVKISDQLVNATLLTNTFTVSGKDAAENDIPEATASTDTTVYTHPFLAVDKTGPAQAYPGQNISYTIKVSNIGGTAAYDVILMDSLPAELIYQSSNPGGSHSDGLVIWQLETIEPGGERIVVVTVKVADDIENNTPLKDTASVVWKNAAEQGFGPVAGTADTVVYTLSRLQITKSGPAEAEVNSLITYTGVLANIGGTVAKNVVLVDQLPPGVSFVSSSQNALYDAVANTVTWNLGDIGAGVSLPGWLTVRIAGDLANASVLTDVFSATGQDPLGNPIPEATATAETTVYTHPLLGIDKTGPAQAYPGQNIEYTITVTNIGGTAANEVVVMDSLPSGLIYQGSNPEGSHSGGFVTWQLGAIEPGGDRTVVVTVKVADDAQNNTQLRDTASAAWKNAAGEHFGPVTASADTRIFTRPQLSVSKTGAGQAYPGEELAFGIEVCNVGGVRAEGVEVVDSMPACFTYQSSSPEGAVQNGTVLWDLGAIEPGQCETISITVLAKEDATDGTYTNLVLASWQDPDENDYGPVSGGSDTLLQTFPSLSIQKSGPAVAYTGQIVAYTIEVTNQGGTPAVDVLVSDSLPSGLTYLDSNPAGSHAAGLVTFDLGTIEAGGSRTITLRATVDLDVSDSALLIDTASAGWKNEEGQAFGPATAQAGTRVYLCPDVVFAPSSNSLKSGRVDQHYSQTITAAGGVGPYDIEFAGGEVPDGLAIDIQPGKIILSGIPAAAGTWSFAIIAKDEGFQDGAGCSIIQEYSVTIFEAVKPVPVLSELGMVLAVFLTGVMGFLALRRRKREQHGFSF
ncbi:IPTL-CTERM sorting domain-containing protein [Desulfatiglans anilini]|uniref:IPTL-CTERM sorting domain-containing protein n=1 Tax=Desulfatiglans anilini TaxID=90728 RepID=UPI00041A6BC5|nr:IPTL-CTERM sorting domain-containing protein [Desulfatiglans anilini]